MKYFHKFLVYIDDTFIKTVLVCIDLGEIQTYAENNNDIFVNRKKDTKFVAITLKGRCDPILLDIDYKNFQEIFDNYLNI